MSSKPMLLALDTSSAWCSVSLASRSTGHVSTACDEAAGNHFEQLATIVNKAMRQAETSFADIGKICVGIGPGSFTGLRIALSYAKGLAWSLKVPLIGVSSFEGAAAAAYEGATSKRSVCVVSDARRGEVFWQCFALDDQQLRTLDTPSICAVSDLVRVAGEVVGSENEADIQFVTTDRVLPIGTLVENYKTVGEVSRGIARYSLESDHALYSIAAISSLTPNYVRAVAAQTIEERNAALDAKK